MKFVRNSRFDLSGNSFFRVFRMNVLDKFFPVGNFSLGIGLKPGLVLLFLHWFGRPLFWLLIRFEPYLHRLYLKLGRNR